MDDVEKTKNKFLTKKRTFIEANADNAEYKEATSVKANVFLFQKNNYSLQFINEYLEWCLDEKKLLDEELLSLPVLEEDPNYINSHNHDQSIISLLRVKYNLPGFRVVFQHGNHSKLKEYRKEGEWMMLQEYCNIFENSPYGQKMVWDKDGIGCTRPISHYLNIKKVTGKLKRKFL